MTGSQTDGQRQLEVPAHPYLILQPWQSPLQSTAQSSTNLLWLLSPSSSPSSLLPFSQIRLRKKQTKHTQSQVPRSVQSESTRLHPQLRPWIQQRESGWERLELKFDRSPAAPLLQCCTVMQELLQELLREESLLPWCSGGWSLLQLHDGAEERGEKSDPGWSGARSPPPPPNVKILHFLIITTELLHINTARYNMADPGWRDWSHNSWRCVPYSWSESSSRDKNREAERRKSRTKTDQVWGGGGGGGGAGESMHKKGLQTDFHIRSIFCYQTRISAAIVWCNTGTAFTNAHALICRSRVNESISSSSSLCSL